VVDLTTLPGYRPLLEDPPSVSEQVVRWVARELGWTRPGLRRRSAGIRLPRVLRTQRRTRAGAVAGDHGVGVGREPPGVVGRSVDHLIASKLLLPGASVLWRLVGTVWHRAVQRGYELIARGVTADVRRGLERLVLEGCVGGVGRSTSVGSAVKIRARSRRRRA
jgi:hypothetical protein